MSANLNATGLANREECALCRGRQFEIAIELPNLPLTGIYSKEPMKDVVTGIDQQLLICTECGHAQLGKEVPAGVLYGGDYSFRTSTSATAQQGTSFFLSMLEEIAPAKRFKCILDVGCNDLYLLKQLEDRAETRVGIDPLWALEKDRIDGKDIILIGAGIEDVDLDSALEVSPDLVICRHTLEHIAEPQVVLQKLINAAAREALFLFEVPGFEPLLHKLRFDQVFHQHLQYFTLASFKRLLEEVGGVFISHRENYHDWGSLLVAFGKRKKDQKKDSKIFSPLFDVAEIQKRYIIFKQQMSTTHDVLKSFKGTVIYGYGAAQMLPILAYHLGNDLSLLTAVLDDDINKDNLYYWNLPLIIRHTSKMTDLESASVFITAIDNVRTILDKLMTRRPRHIIYPFQII
ncbi:MAG: methyltransferase domain-containing protein [Candidatus Omnitrophica bacterium]|nr:methyltransferase domain-containing protein [Candidatus Omnitrophota bacterium]